MDRQNKIIIKDIEGSGGENTYIVTKDNGKISLSSKASGTTVPEEQITQYDGYLVTEFCEQAEYIHNIFPRATNTFRILTFRNHAGDVFVPAVVHRIGSSKTAPLDSFSQGGLSAWVDRSSGELGKAAEPVSGEKPEWHPDTGVCIEGETIPGWRELLLDMKTIAGQLPEMTYVGWDVVVTGPGTFKIIEANSHPNPRVIQVHRPLLKEESVRNFFEYYGLGSR